MKQRARRYITDSEMALIWDRWEKGDSINAIARDLGRTFLQISSDPKCDRDRQKEKQNRHGRRELAYQDRKQKYNPKPINRNNSEVGHSNDFLMSTLCLSGNNRC